MSTTYDVGDAPTVTATFRDLDDALADPTALTVRVLHPDGTVDTYTGASAEVANPSSGVWTFEFPDPIDASGSWRVKFDGTAGLVAAEEVVLSVRATRFPALA